MLAMVFCFMADSFIIINSKENYMNTVVKDFLPPVKKLIYLHLLMVFPLCLPNTDFLDTRGCMFLYPPIASS